MVTKVTSLSAHQIFTKITELSKESRVALAVLGLLALGLAAHMFKKMYYREVCNIPAANLVDVYVSISGNPAHMGHMHMIALAVNRLEKLGYRINEVKVSLASEEYILNKVGEYNLTKNAADMLKIDIPKLKRGEFLKAAIQQAKNEKVVKRDLIVNYYEKGDLFSLHQSVVDGRKIFYVCGTDFADEMPGLVGKQGSLKHVVIVSRDGKVPKEITESQTEEFNRLIVCNNNETTSKYSSSSIQNGAYDQLPPSVRDEFRKLHEAVNGVKPYEGRDHTRVLESTEKLIAQGFYKNPSGDKFALKNGEALSSKSQYFEFQEINPIKQQYKTVIQVVNLDSLGAAQLETKEYKRVLVVNLASPQYPGGGLEGGRGGQEEDLCYRSELAGFMRDQLQIVYNSLDSPDPEHKRLYPLHRHNDIGIPGSVLTPDVTVFRDSFNQNFALLEKPFQISILSSAAPHDLKSISTDVRLIGKGKNSEEYRRVKNEILEDVKQKAKKAIINQLSVASEAGYECVILGAFGCGSFKIPPTIIASLYKDVIETYFSGAFKKIIFAIIDDPKEDHNPHGNLKPFQDCFNSYM